MTQDIKAAQCEVQAKQQSVVQGWLLSTTIHWRHTDWTTTAIVQPRERSSVLARLRFGQIVVGGKWGFKPSTDSRHQVGSIDLSIYQAIHPSIHLKSQDYGYLSAGAQQGHPNNVIKKAWWNKNVLWWRLKVSADCIRWRCDASLFHARGPAVAKERSPNDDNVRGTATVIDSADLRPALALAAADGLMRSTR